MMTEPLFLTKVKLAAALVLAFSVLNGVKGWCAYQASSAEHRPAQRAKSLDAPSRKNKEPRTDLHGDALPPGALARFGTIKQRPGGWELAVTPDGKTVIFLGGHVLRFLDATTGELRRTLQLPGRARSYNPVLSPDGRFAAIGEELGGMNVWETASGKKVHAFAGGP